MHLCICVFGLYFFVEQAISILTHHSQAKSCFPCHRPFRFFNHKSDANYKYHRHLSLSFSLAGHWVFLANCHLSLSWMCELDKLVDELQIQESHPDFRLWLSSSPHPEFPIAILQTGIKITTEPPRVHAHASTRLTHNSHISKVWCAVMKVVFCVCDCVSP